MESYIFPFVGGAIIGIAVSLMLYLNWRVTGVSGIISGVLSQTKDELGWRLNFI